MGTTILKTIQIVSTSDVLGGKPRIEGRRISVEHIVRHHLYEGMSLEDMQTAFGLSPAEIHAALSYYYQHQQDIEHSIEGRGDTLGHIRDQQAHIMDLLEKGISTTQVAAHLGISDRAVRKLIDSGTLPAHKIGREWFIDPADLERPEVKNRRPGRPKQ